MLSLKKDLPIYGHFKNKRIMYLNMI
jgi:hypothetical protein